MKSQIMKLNPINLNIEKYSLHKQLILMTEILPIHVRTLIVISLFIYIH